ncbi:MAG: alpha-glucan family phosphorylase [Chloroflexi bacterium]|nr:alpha-glucan family phosphorylase [Chloroflexota bacterium]
MPERIGRIGELANNLWWSWHAEARRLFASLDYPLWRLSGHNPVKQLLEIDQQSLQSAAADPSFIRLYDSVLAAFDRDLAATETWCADVCPSLLEGPIGYFSMEYAIHNSLPIYAGGLGVLAGDICKEASELGLPLVAVGFMYPQGYFHQHINPDGWQEEKYLDLDFNEAPIDRARSPEGEDIVVRLKMGDFAIAVGVWEVRVGRTRIYLLDTNLKENPEPLRKLSARLYIADRDIRIQQEIVLGIGGVRVLRKLGIDPAIWHANEGHTAFMMLERLCEKMAEGLGFDEAINRIQATTVFTTHTPVPAGHDVFLADSVDHYFGDCWRSIGIDRATFYGLGGHGDQQAFSMAALAMRLSAQRCGVSQLHGRVSRRMWQPLWPSLPEEQVPITHITNGVHVPSWIAPELYFLLEEYLGKDWINRHDDPGLLAAVEDIPDDRLWAVHQRRKLSLLREIRERLRNRWLEDELNRDQFLAMGALLDHDVLTIGFARRFVSYKRPALLFRDFNRFKRILTSKWHPVQIVFAGKTHPADFPSKHLIHQVFSMACDRELEGRTAFVEDYDIHLARRLVQGVDVWLNNPRRLQEASGTSGMKAGLNGVINMSVRDGWWYEGYNGKNGWAIGSELPYPNAEIEDEVDSKAIYHLLEEQVVPLYYDRDRNGVPLGWMKMVKQSIRSVLAQFSTRRMLREYSERMYLPAAAQTSISTTVRREP